MHSYNWHYQPSSHCKMFACLQSQEVIRHTAIAICCTLAQFILQINFPSLIYKLNELTTICISLQLQFTNLSTVVIELADSTLATAFTSCATITLASLIVFFFLISSISSTSCLTEARCCGNL